ncbi:metal-sensing transcriptional repressor, partial [Pseudomonas aeruginosa]
MNATHKHSTHPDLVKRLKRADGHLRHVIGMIESGESCLD